MTSILHSLVLHLPILSTLCASYFCFTLFSRYRRKGGGPHLLWWGIGMGTYGLGTLTESLTTLFGWPSRGRRFTSAVTGCWRSSPGPAWSWSCWRTVTGKRFTGGWRG